MQPAKGLPLQDQVMQPDAKSKVKSRSDRENVGKWFAGAMY